MQRRQKGAKRKAQRFEVVTPDGAILITAPIPENVLRFFIRETCGKEPVYYTPIK